LRTVFWRQVVLEFCQYQACAPNFHKMSNHDDLIEDEYGSAGHATDAQMFLPSPNSESNTYQDAHDTHDNNISENDHYEEEFPQVSGDNHNNNIDEIQDNSPAVNDEHNSNGEHHSNGNLVEQYDDLRANDSTPYGSTDKETIEKLKKANSVLKNQLVELNRMLDVHLSQKGVRVPLKIAAPKRVQSGEKEKGLAKQLEYYKKQTEELKKQLYSSSNLDKIISLENSLKEKRKEVDGIVEENKGLKNQVREQAKALERISSGQDKTIDQMAADYRVLKVQHQQLKEKNAELVGEIDKNHAKYTQLLQKCDKYEQALKSVNLSVDNVALINKLKQESEEKDVIINDLKKKVEVETRSKQSQLKKIQMEMKKQQQQQQQQQPAGDNSAAAAPTAPAPAPSVVVNAPAPAKPLKEPAKSKVADIMKKGVAAKLNAASKKNLVSGAAVPNNNNNNNNNQKSPSPQQPAIRSESVAEEHFDNDFDDLQPHPSATQTSQQPVATAQPSIFKPF